MQRHIDTPLGCLIRRQLRRLRISQACAAERLGISRQGLGKILSGQTTKPDIDLLAKLAAVLEISESVMFRVALESLNSAPSLAPVIESNLVADNSIFVRDVSVPDMSLVSTGAHFTKKWQIQNAGQQYWRNRCLRCVDDEYVMARREPCGRLIEHVSLSLKPAVREIRVPDTAPGAVVTLAVDFTAPTHPCVTLSTWKMVDQQNQLCFPDMAGVWCLVKVFDL